MSPGRSEQALSEGSEMRKTERWATKGATRPPMRPVRTMRSPFFALSLAARTGLASAGCSFRKIDAGMASDASAIIEHTSQVMYLGDNELLVLSAAGISAKTLDQRPVEKQIDTLQITLDEIELGDFPHHMLKEIHEQPRSLRDALAGRTDLRRAVVTLGGLKKLERQIAQYRQLLMFGCGTAWHGGERRR